MIEHPVFARPMDKDKVVLLTIVDRASLPFVKDDCFIIARTETSIYSGNHPIITLNKDTVLDSKEYLNTIDSPWDTKEDTHGSCPSDLLRRSIWFIKKVKSVFEMMG